ncbi:FMN-binding protein [Thiobacter aerophilum]|uniref:FMN-binding protein n=1 Tax=Thiobacter aerophilum TaxID=3121275 RepID=A0ABV0EIQ3_9BURK
MRHDLLWLSVPALAAAALPAHAVQYLTLEQAQHALFPEASGFRDAKLLLSAEQREAIEKASKVRVRSPELHAWRAEAGGKLAGWLLVDEVYGKHEFITYALALDATGAVRGIEIMDYRETHGAQVRNAAWRAQFIGKRAGAPLELDKDIQNISGATLSCKHMAEGVRRLLATYEVALK